MIPSPLRLTVLVLTLALSPAASAQTGSMEFVESWPEGTPLDLPELRDAPVVWPLVLGEATRGIEVASFYFSRKDDGKDAYGPAASPDLLRPALDALAAAGGRGVPVRVLGDAGFLKTYPQAPAWLGEQPGVAFRPLDARGLWGGVLHAKYFVADDALYVGSQNWDWRALGQIHELGVLVRHPRLADDLRRVFALDWALAGGETAAADAGDRPAARVVNARGDTLTAVLAASPERALPAGVPWDLPLLIGTIDAAVDSVHLQLLSYGTTDREKRLFDDLDRALRRAAVRGARVRVILANWSKSKYRVEWIKSLAAIPGVEIRFTNIPEHPGGFIPFARVEHAKYLTVDGNACWIGTSNWSRDYFYDSRNVSLFFTGPGAARDADSFFNLSWHGPYAETVSPCGDYTPPRRQ